MFEKSVAGIVNSSGTAKEVRLGRICLKDARFTVVHLARTTNKMRTTTNTRMCAVQASIVQFRLAHPVN